MIKKNLYLFIIAALLLFNSLTIVFQIGIIGPSKNEAIFIVISTLIILLIYCFNFYLSFRNKQYKFDNVYLNFANFLIFTPLLYFSSAVAFYVLYLFIPRDTITLNQSYFIQMSIEIFVYLFMYLLFYKKEIHSQARDFINNIGIYFLYVIIFYMLATVLGSLTETISYLMPNSDNPVANQSLIESTLEIGNNMQLFIISMVFISPIIEEFVYRYLLIEKFIIPIFGKRILISEDFYKTDVNERVKVKNFMIMIFFSIISGFVFASAHAMAAPSIIDYARDLLVYSGFSIGISFAYLYTRNIFVTISIHMLNNFLSVYFLLMMLNSK